MFSVTKPPWLPLSSESLPTRRYTAALDDSLPSLQFDSDARPRHCARPLTRPAPPPRAMVSLAAWAEVEGRMSPLPLQ